MKLKAVLVVTKRFLDIWKEDPPVNCLLIGVEDKLVSDQDQDESSAQMAAPLGSSDA